MLTRALSVPVVLHPQVIMFVTDSLSFALSVVSGHSVLVWWLLLWPKWSSVTALLSSKHLSSLHVENLTNLLDHTVIVLFPNCWGYTEVCKPECCHTSDPLWNLFIYAILKGPIHCDQTQFCEYRMRPCLPGYCLLVRVSFSPKP